MGKIRRKKPAFTNICFLPLNPQVRTCQEPSTLWTVRYMLNFRTFCDHSCKMAPNLPLAKLNALAGKWLKKGSLTEYSLTFSQLCPLSWKRIHFYTKYKTYFYFLINQMGFILDIESFLGNNIMLTFVSSQNLNIRVRLEAWQRPRKMSVDSLGIHMSLQDSV